MPTKPLTHIEPSMLTPADYAKPTVETPSYKVESFYPNRWPLMLKGLDESGRERVLALDWDGRWHDLSPGRSPERRVASSFPAGAFARLGDMVVRRRGISILASNPPQTAWASPGGGTCYVRADDMLEPVEPRTQRADQFNVGDRCWHGGDVWARTKADVSIEYVAFSRDGNDVLLVDADTEMEVAP